VTDRADEIVTSEDFPFETTVCPECGVRHSDIPALMKAAEQIRAYGDECRNAALEEAAQKADEWCGSYSGLANPVAEHACFNVMQSIRALKEPKP